MLFNNKDVRAVLTKIRTREVTIDLFHLVQITKLLVLYDKKKLILNIQI